jgi:hypothetical protein
VSDKTHAEIAEQLPESILEELERGPMVLHDHNGPTGYTETPRGFATRIAKLALRSAEQRVPLSSDESAAAKELRETPTRLLVAYTPERYEGAYPPYFNVTQVGSMVKITMRGATKAEGSGGDTAVAVVNVWTLNEIAKAFKAAREGYDINFDHDPASFA